MKKIISLFVIATMIVAAMSITTSAADVTAIDQFAFDGTVNKLTANIDSDIPLHLTDPAQNLVVDLNGFTWESGDVVLKVDNGASATVYDSSEARTGTIKSRANDAISISNGALNIENITVIGGDDGMDAVFAAGGNISIKGCKLSAGKAGLDAANGSAAAGVPVVAVITDTVFDTYANPGDRNCAIELRAYSADESVTICGNTVFNVNKVMIRSEYNGPEGVADVIAAGEGATISFTDPAAVAGRDNYTYSEITYTYTAPEGGEGEDEDEDNPETGDAFVVVAATVAAFALAGVVVSKKVRA